MGRKHTEPNYNLAILAGTLQHALRMHAAQRLNYFFSFLFYYKALTERLRSQHGLTLTETEGVSVKATHQIAFGLRRDNPGYYDFVVSDPEIIHQSATNCGRTDAAHYCNLGIKAAFIKKITPYVGASVDRMAFDFFDSLEVYAGATRQLPQRINIGPDRIVDVLHGKMAMSMLNGGPPLTSGNYMKYLGNCDREMARYRKTILGKGYHGLAACCQCYLDLYRGDPGCERPMTAMVSGGSPSRRSVPNAAPWGWMRRCTLPPICIDPAS